MHKETIFIHYFLKKAKLQYWQKAEAKENRLQSSLISEKKYWKTLIFKDVMG